MDLFLIRHGQSEADLLYVHEGRADFLLTDEGQRQAKAMAQWMAKQFSLDRIYTSTLKRAVQTAGYLGEACGLVPILDADLMERNNGLLASMEYDKAKEKYPQAGSIPIYRASYNMEPMLDFRFRAERVLLKILEESNGLAAIAVVAHGGIINQFFHCLLSLPFESCIAFPTADTAFITGVWLSIARCLYLAIRQNIWQSKFINIEMNRQILI